MEQFPKIVSQRLQAVRRSEVHPDANLLTSFAEKSLLPREQAQVLEHLAGCAVCREVVAFAQSEEVLERVAVTAAAPNPVRGRAWFQGAVLRWAALAACVVVVGTVVISRTYFSKRSPQAIATYSEPTVVAKNDAPPTSSRPPAEETSARQSEHSAARLKGAFVAGAKRDGDELSELDKQRPAKTLPSVSGARRQEVPERVFETKNNSLSSPEAFGLGSAAAAPPISKADDAKANKKEFSADKAMKAPVATETVEVTNEAVQVQAESAPAPPVPAAKPIGGPSLADSQKVKSGSGEVGALYRSKDGYVTGGAVAGLSSELRFPHPRWQLSAEGKLVKSSDLGKSWHAIEVGDKTVFRALCVTDREIWVGGVQGELFYSSDAGEHWEQVKPSANGKNLTTDITAIEFADPQHGKVTTASHESWITSDGGHAWQVETR